jgi:hypothetical protein
VEVGEPRVLVDCLERSDGQRFVWLISQSDAPLTVTPRAGSGLPLHDLDTGAEISIVELAPYGVHVLRTALPGTADLTVSGPVG